MPLKEITEDDLSDGSTPHKKGEEPMGPPAAPAKSKRGRNQENASDDAETKRARADKAQDLDTGVEVVEEKAVEPMQDKDDTAATAKKERQPKAKAKSVPGVEVVEEKAVEPMQDKDDTAATAKKERQPKAKAKSVPKAKASSVMKKPAAAGLKRPAAAGASSKTEVESPAAEKKIKGAYKNWYKKSNVTGILLKYTDGTQCEVLRAGRLLYQKSLATMKF